MGDSRLKILEEARRILEEEGQSQIESESLFKLLEILAISVEKFPSEESYGVQEVARELINNRVLLAMLKQQTDELDTLKKLSINLTSSLDLPDVLDAVVSEAMRLIKNAHDINIFLYKNHKLNLRRGAGFGWHPQQALVNASFQRSDLYGRARRHNDHH